MNFVFLGPPGAGKGTVAKIISQSRGIPHISTGDLFRENIKNETELGIKVKELLAKGLLVPDDVTSAMVKNRLEKNDILNGYIMDGYPRTIIQAEAFSTFSKIDTVVNFLLDDDSIMARLSGRRTCSRCGNMHHILFMPPKQEGICDICGGSLIIRDDDKPESIKKRLAVYSKQTEPLIEYYKKKGILHSIDAGSEPALVAEQVELLNS